MWHTYAAAAISSETSIGEDGHRINSSITLPEPPLNNIEQSWIGGRLPINPDEGCAECWAFWSVEISKFAGDQKLAKLHSLLEAYGGTTYSCMLYRYSIVEDVVRQMLR